MQPADRISALNSLVKPSSEFALIRTHRTLLVAELKWITSCQRKPGWYTHVDTNKQIEKRAAG